MVSPESIHASNIQTEQVVFMYLGIYVYIHTYILLMKKEAMNFKESKKWIYMREGRKRRNYVIIISKIRKSGGPP